MGEVLNSGSTPLYSLACAASSSGPLGGRFDSGPTGNITLAVFFAHLSIIASAYLPSGVHTNPSFVQVIARLKNFADWLKVGPINELLSSYVDERLA